MGREDFVEDDVLWYRVQKGAGRLSGAEDDVSTVQRKGGGVEVNCSGGSGVLLESKSETGMRCQYSSNGYGAPVSRWG